ncbi:MAG: acetyl-CoA carboxylase biotin carboxyl carrier protein [Parvibaculales bacterium]|jgi:acetyl-CoA carboxylase biotin carboxyl carrier protein
MTKLPDSKLIKELADLLDKSSLTEIEVEAEGMRIRVARQGASQMVTSQQTIAQPAPMAPTPAPEAAAAPVAAANPASNAGAVKSPMVGTAYLAPEPGAKDFVSIGSTVKQGQTLLIIEAMKTMNPITAPRDGKVTEIIVTNEQPVEFDEVLLIIE